MRKITMEEMLFNFIMRISMLSVVLFQSHVNINNHRSIVLMMRGQTDGNIIENDMIVVYIRHRTNIGHVQIGSTLHSQI